MWFLKFIGVCEVLGALGLVLPGLFRRQQYLTVLAAIGLLIIMIGAVVTSAMTMGPVVIMIAYLLIARKLGAFDAL